MTQGMRVARFSLLLGKEVRMGCKTHSELSIVRSWGGLARALAVCVVAIGTSACRDPAAPPAAPDDADAAVPLAEIDGMPAAAAELEDRLERWRVAQAREKRAPDPRRIAQRRLILARRLVDEELVARMAREAGIAVDRPSDAELIAAEEQRLGGAAFARHLAVTGETRAEIARRLWTEELLARLTAEPPPAPDEAAVAAEVARRRERPEQVRVRWLPFAAGGLSAEQRARLERRAREALAVRDLAQWIAGERGTEAQRLRSGWLARAELPPEVAAWAFTAAPRSRRVITAANAFHVVELLERRPALRRPVDEVAREVRDDLGRAERQRRRDALLVELRRKWKVTEPLFQAGVAERRAARARAQDPALRPGARKARP